MSGDMTHFLLPTSRLPTDVTFLVGGAEVTAHRSILATALPAFDSMFYGPEVGAGARVEVEGASPDTFKLFLHHAYGRRVEVEALVDLRVLVELATLASRWCSWLLFRMYPFAVKRSRRLGGKISSLETLTYFFFFLTNQQ